MPLRSKSDRASYAKKWYKKNRRRILKSAREYSRTYFKKNRQRVRKTHRRYYYSHLEKIRRQRKQYKDQLLEKIYAHYGNACACCGEREFLFLTLDHIKGCGAKHRKQVGVGRQFYVWIIKHRYPKSLRLMCFNCNCGRARNGGICPHKRTPGGH